MAKRWYIFKDGSQKDQERQGPFTAKELREGLRGGSIDPFDLISLEGLNIAIKQPLVEVDEIFQNDQRAEGTSDSFDNNIPIQKSPAVKSENQQVPAPKEMSSSQNPEQQNAHHTSPKQFPGDALKKKGGKKFFAINGKKHEAGPFTADEIASLFKKGILDGSVNVKKKNSSQLVSIDKFLEAYRPSGNFFHKPQIILQRSLHAAKIVFSKRKSSKLIAAATVALVFIIGTLGVWRLNLLPFTKSENRVTYSSPDEDYENTAPIDAPIKHKKPVKNKTTKVLPQSQSLNTASSNIPSSPTHNNVVQKDKKTVPLVTPVSKAKTNQKPATPKKPAKKNVATSQPVYKKPVTNPAISPITPVAITQKASANPAAPIKNATAVTTPKTTPKATPKPTPSPTVASTTAANAASSPNSTLTLNGVTFDKSQLQNCMMKCNILVKDGSGKSYAVSFFTGAFMNQLRAKPGPFTFQGFMGTQGGGKVFILKSVN